MKEKSENPESRTRAWAKERRRVRTRKCISNYIKKWIIYIKNYFYIRIKFIPIIKSDFAYFFLLIIKFIYYIFNRKIKKYIRINKIYIY